eukprot:979953_1
MHLSCSVVDRMHFTEEFSLGFSTSIAMSLLNSNKSKQSCNYTVIPGTSAPSTVEVFDMHDDEEPVAGSVNTPNATDDDDCKDLDALEVFDFVSFQTKGELYTQWKKYESLVQKHINTLLETEPDKELLAEILKLNTYITKNQHSLSQNTLASSPVWQTKVNWYPQKELYPLMDQISKLYRDDAPHISYEPSRRLTPTLEPELNRINSKFDRNWTAPNVARIRSTMFDRECTKYWVKNENIMAVIAAIIPNLPIYRHPLMKDKSVAPQISSVYLDDDDFKCYHERINKEEDARVVRLRWYGEDKQIVFIERKLHKKGDEQSIKERFRMKEEHIVEFMGGTDHFDTKVNKGEHMKSLHREVSEMIQMFELKPTTRIVYNRMSFQLDHTNAIRISLDTDLHFVSEKPWLLDRYQWHTQETDIGNHDVEWFPFNVLELKLCGKYIDTPPQWINDLMESDLLMSCYKFSKYGQSIYSFHANEIYIIPKWIEEYPQYFDEEEKKMALHVGYEEELKVSEPKEEVQAPSTTKCICCGRKEKDTKRGKKKKKIMNPKVYFSNERTFLQWFQAAVFVGSAGLTIRSMNPDDVAAILLISTSFLILMWAVVIYYRRNYRLLRNEQEGLHDLYGPAVLVSVMIFVMGYSITNGANVFGAAN